MDYENIYGDSFVKEPHAIEVLRNRVDSLVTELANLRNNPHSIRIDVWQSYNKEILKVNNSLDYFMRRMR